jgi:hypothetical protein
VNFIQVFDVADLRARDLWFLCEGRIRAFVWLIGVDDAIRAVARSTRGRLTGGKHVWQAAEGERSLPHAA